MPDTEISVLCKSSHLVVTKFFYPHFIREKTVVYKPEGHKDIQLISGGTGTG